MKQYLLVGKESESFGYKRVMQHSYFYIPVREFIEKRGLPDMLYEDTEDKKQVLYLFYIANNLVYEFFDHESNPDAIYLRNQRALTGYEKTTYDHLKSKNE